MLLICCQQSAYDRLLNARKASALRNRQLDGKRKKLKDELEARERAAKEDVISEAEATAKLSAEIERLRKEGSKQLEKENELLKKEIEEELRQKVEIKLRESERLPRIKVKRKLKTTNFNDESLRQYFSQFGDISCLVIAKNNKRAVIEFSDYESALKVSRFEHESYSVESIEAKPQMTTSEPQNHSIEINKTIESNKFSFENNQSFDSDYESIVLRNLRLAEERKKLIKQLEEEEERSNK